MRTHHILVAASVALSSLICTSGAGATTIGVTMSKFDDTFLTGVREAIEAEGKAQGVMVLVDQANDDVSEQATQIRRFIDQKVDAIIVNAVDTSSTPRLTALAQAAHVPLVYVNRRPEDATLPPRVTFVGSNEKVSGVLQAEELVKCMKGTGNLVILQGQLSNISARERTADVEQVAARTPGITVIRKAPANWDRKQAQAVMGAWLKDGTPIAGVASNNDEMAIGAIAALKAAGTDPRSVCVGGIDATAGGLAEMARGDLTVTVFQDARQQGKGAVDAALAMIKGETVPATVDIPFEKVTRDNLQRFMR